MSNRIEGKSIRNAGRSYKPRVDGFRAITQRGKVRRTLVAHPALSVAATRIRIKSALVVE